ncbi:MAG: hypothetical protein JOZ74_07905 [Bradyrhizobium sp.]|nr:hypothetical protein [Bradyrhizobium sp.]
MRSLTTDFAAGKAKTASTTSEHVYGALTTWAHHQIMKNRGNTSAVSKGPDRDHALLTAFLEATDKIDRRAVQKRDAISAASKQAPEPVNLEAQPTSTASRVTSFSFRRANLVKS